MAGGAGTYAVDGVSYSTVAAALAQLIADEDGAATTATQNIVISINPTESGITLPTQAQVDSSITYPIVIKSANAGSPQTLTCSSGDTFESITSCPYIEIQDLNFVGSGSGEWYRVRSPMQQNKLHARNCDIDGNSGAFFMEAFNNVQVEFTECTIRDYSILVNGSITQGAIVWDRCKIQMRDYFTYNYYRGAFYFIQCRMKCDHASNPLFRMAGYDLTLVIDGCTIHAATSGALYQGVSNQTGVEAFPVVHDSVIHGVTKGFEWTVPNGGTVPTAANKYGRNIWSAYGGGDFLNSTYDNIATLAAFQAIGFETGSEQETVSFVSTDVTSDDFLKLASTPSHTVKSGGLYADAFGTARERYDGITPGAYQPVALPEIEADEIITSAGGNYDDTNLIDANVKLGVTYGLSSTGTYNPVGAAPDAPTITLTAGDEEITVTLTPADGEEAIPMYVRYCLASPGTAWSDESETLARTGAGDVVLSGLTNGKRYWVVAYHKDGTILGIWSLIASATPTDGAATVGPAMAVRQLLVDSGAVAALVGARVMPEYQAQGGDLPAITYRVISGQHAHTTSGASGSARVRVEVQCHADSYQGAENLADAARLALDGYRGTVSMDGGGSLYIDSLLLDDDSGVYLQPMQGDSIGVHTMSKDFWVRYSESVPSF